MQCSVRSALLNRAVGKSILFDAASSSAAPAPASASDAFQWDLSKLNEHLADSIPDELCIGAFFAAQSSVGPAPVSLPTTLLCDRCISENCHVASFRARAVATFSRVQ
jgi:hypothetical protein